MSHEDQGHGHITLEYQPALPLRNGKLFMWLFLSTEIMFFAALIGMYIVLRFGSPTWPIPSEVHLSEPIGAFNTFVLICSSVTIVLALEFARANNDLGARGFLFLTLLLGCIFLGVKGYEYKAKFSHGLYPWYPRSRIYEKADVYYGAAVRERGRELLAANSAGARQPRNPLPPRAPSLLQALSPLQAPSLLPRRARSASKLPPPNPIASRSPILTRKRRPNPRVSQTKLLRKNLRRSTGIR